MADLFMDYSRGGRIEVAFLGVAQIDRFGNINTTVIGSHPDDLSAMYRSPAVRLPGSGGACEIALHAKKVYIITRLQRRSFVERLAFITSVGHLAGRPGERDALGIRGQGPGLVVTDKAVFDVDPATHEMRLISVHPGVTVDQVRREISWPLCTADEVQTTEPPEAEELRIIREELDPSGMYSS